MDYHSTAKPAPPNDTGKQLSVDEKESGLLVKENTGPAMQQPERKPSFKDYVRVFSYATNRDYVMLGSAALASIGAGATMPLMNIVFGQQINNFNSFGTGPNNDFEHKLNYQSLLIFILFLARFALNYVNKFCFRLIGIRMSAAIRLHYLRSLFGQTIHVLDSMPSGAAASTITSTSDTLQLGISEKLGTFLEFGSTLVFGIIVAFTHSWSLTLVAASVILFIGLVLSILLPYIIRGHSRYMKCEAQATSIATEAFSAARMVTSCGAEDRVARNFAEWVTKAREAGQSTSPLIAAQFGLIFTGLYANFGLSFWYGSKSFSEGRIRDVGTIIIVLMSVMLMIISLGRMATPLIAASKAMVAAADFFVVIDAPQPPRGTLKEPDVVPTEDIVFTDVDFAYPSRPCKKVLDGLNLRIRAQKNTAIVGPSGSGKSTLVALLEGWYSLLHHDYAIAKAVEKHQIKLKKKHKKNGRGKGAEKDERENTNKSNGSFSAENQGLKVEIKGKITISGHTLDEVDIRWWRSQIGLVQQEPFLFNDSIFNNVSAGLIGTQWETANEETKRKMVKEACVESFADEFINRLPDGYNTEVGESGVKLSGGQRQRIAIARSIISKPQILILDEATSAIDVRGEEIVQAALERASKGRTTITIAHRLSTIKNADVICVLQNGRMVEQGSHDSLLAKEDGVYHGLVHAQQLSLGDDESGGEALEGAVGPVLSRENSLAQTEHGVEAVSSTNWTPRNLFDGFGLLLAEQHSQVPLYMLAIIGAIGVSAAAPLQAFLFSKIIVVFQDSDRQKLLEDVAFWSKMWVVLAVGVGVSYFLTGAVSTVVEYFIAAVYRREYFESILFQKTSYFDLNGNAVGQLTARLSSDPQALKELLGFNMVMLLTGMFSLSGALCISFAYGWKLALVALGVTVPLGVVAGYWRIQYELQFNAMNHEVFQMSSKFGAEAISAFRTVCSLVMEESIGDRYEKLLHKHVTQAFKKAQWTTLVFAFSDSVSLGCQALIFWYGGRLLLSGEYDVTAFFVTYMAMIQGAESAGQWISFGPNAAQASMAATRILQARGSRTADSIDRSEAIPDTEKGVKIELENIHFKYPTRDISVLKGLNLTIEKGRYAAIVGASGSGKTSIISLVERFYDPDEGRILFNGKDIKEVNVYEYRKMLSLVAQEPSLFNGTIRENILLGVKESEVTDEQLYQCGRDANIHEFIISLPDGYNTNIGSKGVSLSGGQKQRVSIARALIRNPRVLLLDEATSSLDSENEKLVQAAFERMAKGRTTIAVAHRLATIQNADIIFVLGGDGKVIEKGNHVELLGNRGVYWKMCQNQALDR